MKKFTVIALILIFVFVIIFSSCGKDKDNDNGNNNDSSQVEESSADTPEDSSKDDTPSGIDLPDDVEDTSKDIIIEF